MPMFHYEATDQSGKTVVGSMSATDEGTLRDRLAKNGYQPTLVQTTSPVLSTGRTSVATGAGPSPSAVYTPPAGAAVGRERRPAVVVPDRDLTQFYRQMASMLGSGVALPQAIAQLLPYTRNRYLKEALQDVEATVERGYPMSQALERHPRAFSAGHVGVIRSGEGGGFTVRALAELANQTEADVGVQTSAKFNPLLFLIRYVGAPFVVAWLVFMSGLTAWTANLGLLQVYLIRAAIAFGATIAFQAMAMPLIGHAIRLSPLGRILASLRSVMPGLNAIQTRRDRVKTLASLSSAMAAGVPLSLAWQLSCEAADSDHFQSRMAEQQPAVTQGGSIAEAMGRTGLFTDRIMQVAHTGELSGNLPEMLQQATTFESDEARHMSNLVPWVVAVGAYLLFIFVVAYFIISFGSKVYGGPMSGQ